MVQDGHQDEDSPQAVDHRRNGRQQLHHERDGAAQKPWAQLGHEDRNSHRQRNGQHQGHQRGDQRSVEERQSAKVARDRVPGISHEKMEAEAGNARVWNGWSARKRTVPTLPGSIANRAKANSGKPHPGICRFGCWAARYAVRPGSPRQLPEPARSGPYASRRAVILG